MAKAGPAPVFPSHLPALKWQVALAVLAGLLHGFSQPFVLEAVGPRPLDPTGLSGLLVFIGYVPLLYVVRDTTTKRAFWLAFVFLITKYTLVLYWVTVAITVYTPIPWIVAVLLLVLLSAAVAAPLSATVAGARMLCQRFGLPFWLVLPAAFTGGEFIRNFGFLGGFPWGAAGYSLASVPLFLQTAALVGVYGLVFLILLVNAGLNEGVTALRAGRPLPRAPLVAAAAILVGMAGYGALRLSTEPEAERTLQVALLQGNIEQGIKNNERLHYKRILSRYWELQGQAVEAGADLVVWPEAAVPVAIKADLEELTGTLVVPKEGRWAEAVPPSAIIGASAVEYVRDPESGERVRKRYNTAFATEGGLVVKGRFDKVHLVPFGEYVPWPFHIAVKHLVPGSTTPGAGYRAATVNTPEGPVTVGATICYEGAFPEITQAYLDDGAELMFNITNDAWYGISSMTWQHTLMYAMRAVESGRPIARAANTGVSAWVDTRGRVHDRSGMYETTYVMADIPLNAEDTVYSTVGDFIGLLCTVIILALWFYALAGIGFWRRERHPLEWAVGGVGVAVALWTLVDHHFIRPPDADAGSTGNQLQFVFSILIGLGALSGRPWGRRAQIAVAVVVVALAGAGLFFGSSAGVFPALVAAAAGGLAFIRKEAYQRPPDPCVTGPYAPASSDA